MIVTSNPELVKNGIIDGLSRGVTVLSGQGGYTGEQRTILYCVITRAEVSRLKAVVSESDQRAFMVIGQAYEALGEGFHPFEK
jgi:uncharacterized membrane-anchored protein YitT (DUF2179 family)